MYWFDIAPLVAIAAILVGATALSIWGWVHNRREELERRSTHASRHERFLRFLASIRAARQ